MFLGGRVGGGLGGQGRGSGWVVRVGGQDGCFGGGGGVQVGGCSGWGVKVDVLGGGGGRVGGSGWM